MRLKRNRKAYRFFKRTKGALGNNALLMGGMGLPFVVMAAVSLRASVALIIAMICAVIPAYIACVALGKKVDVIVRSIVCTALSVVGVMLSRQIIGFISPEIFDTLGIFLPLMAINSLVVACCLEKKPKPAKLSGRLALGVVGFSLVAILVGGLRELFVAGNLWGVNILEPQIPIAGTVFFGFLFLGLLAALAQKGRRIITAINYRLDNPTLEQLQRQEKERMVD